MDSSNLEPRDESTKSLHDYLSNNNYKNLISFSLIFMFSLVFYCIYLLVDSIIDKDKHHKYCLMAFEKYEKSCQMRKHKKQQQQQLQTPADLQKDEDEDASINVDKLNKEKLMERNRKLDFTIWSNRNLQISFIHSTLSSLWIIRILALRHTELFDDLLFHVSWDTYLLIAFSCGYFLYDFYDIYANGYFKKEWVVCAHHWIVLVSFSYHLTNLLSIGYTVVALMMEFNSVFLHARKLLRFYGYKADSGVVLANSVANILTFLVFRFGVIYIIFYGVFVDGHRVSTGYLIMLTTCAFLMAIINVVLFYQIVSKDLAPLIRGLTALFSCDDRQSSAQQVTVNGNCKSNGTTYHPTISASSTTHEQNLDFLLNANANGNHIKCF